MFRRYYSGLYVCFFVQKYSCERATAQLIWKFTALSLFWCFGRVRLNLKQCHFVSKYIQ
jgi:hypothetical protein